MKIANLIRTILLALAGIGCLSQASAQAPQQGPSCRMADDDRRWVQSALSAWPIVLRNHLGGRPRRLPPIIVYDRDCSYRLASASDSIGRWIATRHRNGHVLLPSRDWMAPQARALHTQAGLAGPFTVMALPSVWRAVTPASEIPLDQFLEGVLLHELTHAYQGTALPATTLIPMLGRGGVPADLNTESLERAFKGNAVYARDRAVEDALLRAAATAPSDSEARLQACRASDQLREIRGRHFRGRNAYWAAVDDIFLVSEGLAQWTHYIWLTRERGVAEPLARAAILRATATHNRAFLLWLTVDRLVPDWRSRLLSERPQTAAQLLAAACSADIRALS